MSTDRPSGPIAGDKAHPSSEGYTSARSRSVWTATRTAPQRLTTPLRRRRDGTFEAIDWDTAIAEIAGRLRDVVDSTAARRSSSTAVAAKATTSVAATAQRANAVGMPLPLQRAGPGEDRRDVWSTVVLRRSRCHTTGDFEHAEVVVFWGKNPWQSHGFPRARPVLKAIAGDPGPLIVVITRAQRDCGRSRRHPPPARCPAATRGCSPPCSPSSSTRTLVDHGSPRTTNGRATSCSRPTRRRRRDDVCRGGRAGGRDPRTARRLGEATGGVSSSRTSASSRRRTRR